MSRAAAAAAVAAAAAAAVAAGSEDDAWGGRSGGHRRQLSPCLPTTASTGRPDRKQMKSAPGGTGSGGGVCQAGLMAGGGLSRESGPLGEGGGTV